MGASVPTAQPEPWLPLRPALLNGYKLEDKSAGFQAILSSISGNCCSPSSCARMEEERRKTLSLLGLSPAANKHAEGAFLLGLDAWGRGKAGGSSLGGVRPRQRLLFIEHLLCARHCEGCQAAARQINEQLISRAVPTGTSVVQGWRGGLAWLIRRVDGEPV